MTQRAQSPDNGAGRRTHLDRPPRTGRGGDLAPYPGARVHSTTAGAGEIDSASRPEGTPASSRRRSAPSSTAPTPATVWACGPDPIDTHEVWPVPIVESITAAFTDPGAHVVLVDLGPAPAAVPRSGAGGSATTGEASPAAAREAVRALGRTADTVPFHSDGGSAASARPFWADLVTDASDASAALAGTPSAPARTGASGSVGGPVSERGARADLVIVSLPGHVAESVSLDRLALLAATRLRQGGILAVYTHSDWTRGRLTDPTGAIVAAAQHADLLYLQHIVVLQTPVEKGRLRAAEYDRARHRATVRGLPAPHLRAHGDVLAFAQPADPGAPPAGTGPVPAAPGAGGGQ
ncbi:hypothetical protein ACFWMR_04790 [Amycolatopsis thailandensis]|uniref:hypothetical protein n=1 Tax=Amycolatopsis thailandensis TaxID=589330 RepID=UPI00364EC94C